jgi:HlyD family secretion protein
MKTARTRLVLPEPPSEPELKQAPKLAAVPMARRPEILEFQSDAVELEESAPPGLARLTLYAVALFLACATAWASLSSIDEIVVAPGKLVTTRPMLVVQPLETSIIRSIEVKVGDVVHAGQPLATLDPTFVEADADQLQGKMETLNAQIARIKAELAGKSYEPPAQPTADEILQAGLFSQRKAYYDAKLHDFATQTAQAAATLAAARDEEGVLIKRLDGLHQIDDMRSTLADKGTGSRLSYLQGHDLSLDVEANLGRVRGSQTETRQTLEKAKAERETFIEDFRRTSMEKLVELRDTRAAVGEELKKADLRRSMSILTAPSEAAVLDIAQRSIGSVAREAEPLFTLVPLNVPLEAEVTIAAKDIGYVAQNDTARVKFDAFPFQKHGTANGTVRTLSQDTFAPDQKALEKAPGGASPFYRARIELPEIKLRSLPAGFRFIPGMTLQAEIVTGHRTVISYFLYPLLRGLDESLREP